MVINTPYDLLMVKRLFLCVTLAFPLLLGGCVSSGEIINARMALQARWGADLDRLIQEDGHRTYAIG
jgi:hypothetical protein